MRPHLGVKPGDGRRAKYDLRIANSAQLLLAAALAATRDVTSFFAPDFKTCSNVRQEETRRHEPETPGAMVERRGVHSDRRRAKESGSRGGC